MESFRDSVQQTEGVPRAHGGDPFPLPPFYDELIRYLKKSLFAIGKVADLSYPKFSDKSFADAYHQTIKEEIQGIDLVLNGILDYVGVTSPVKNDNTLLSFLNKVVEEHRTQLIGKKIKLLTRFEKNLPDTIVPEGHLMYILNFLLRLVIAVVPPGKTAWLLARSSSYDTANVTSSKGQKQCVEIIAVCSTYDSPSGRLDEQPETLPFIMKGGLNLILPLVKDLVQRNLGTMKFQWKEKRASLLLQCPLERRKVIRYDFSRTRRAKEPLEHPAEAPMAMSDNASIGIFRGLPNGRIIAANNAFSRLLGYDSIAELLNTFKNPSARLHVEPDELSAILLLLEEKGSLQDVEARVYQKDGGILWVSENVWLLRDANGKLLYFEGSMQDITMQKRSAAKRIAKQKMEVARRMAGGIAHEVNNLLAVILLSSDLLSEIRQADPKALEHIEAIKRTVERAHEFTRRLRTIGNAQVTNGKILNLNDLIRAMRNKLEGVLGKDISYREVLEPHLTDVKGDSADMEEIILNLATNAGAAISGRGEWTLLTENRLVDQEYCLLHPEADPGEYVVVEASDTGTGIPPEIMEHLFEPFPGFTTGGKGLGLAVVHSLVEKWGGHINVRSQKDKGTSFTIHLPAIIKTRNESNHVSPPQKKTVLIVEEDAAVLTSMAELITKLGHTALSAPSADEAWARLRDHSTSVDVLLTNIALPEQDGFEFASKLRSKYPRMKVILRSAYPEEWNANTSILNDGTHILPRTPDMSTVAKTLGKLLME